MSGHSKWSTIHRAKAVKDQARGKLFSKFAKAITIAVKEGGGPDPDSNYKLRMEIDRAKASNMPKINIDRAISKGGGGDDLAEVKYEGFGPGGVSIIVQTATDNRNRTGQEIKGLFERGGGQLAGPGAVAFNFQPRVLAVIQKAGNGDEQMLKLIDYGVEEMEQEDDGIEVYLPVETSDKTVEKLREAGFIILSMELVQKPVIFQPITDPAVSEKVLKLLETLSDHDDVQKVFANLDLVAPNAQ